MVKKLLEGMCSLADEDIAIRKKKLFENYIKYGSLNNRVITIRKSSNGDQGHLSWTQESIYHGAQNEAATSLLHMSYGVQVTGKLNVRLFMRAIRALVERHEALRTLYDDKNGKPVAN